MNTKENFLKNAKLKVFKFDETNNIKCGDMFIIGLEVNNYRIIDGDYSVYKVYDRFNSIVGYKICHPRIELFISSKTIESDFSDAVYEENKPYFEDLFNDLISEIKERTKTSF